MKKFSLVIFDMDGLMFDTEKLSLRAWEKAGKELGYNIDENIIAGARGLNSQDTVPYFQKYFGKSFPYSAVREIHSAYFEEYIQKNGIPVKKGLYELIDFLETQSIPKAVATSTARKKAERCLELGRVKDRFDLIVCGDEVLRGKPEPDIFLKAADKLKYPPENCIVLEDSENGLRAALKAGMLPICVPDLAEPSEEVRRLIFKEFNSLYEVRDFLESELNSSFEIKEEWA